jgi:hypothetical protein
MDFLFLILSWQSLQHKHDFMLNRHPVFPMALEFHTFYMGSLHQLLTLALEGNAKQYLSKSI